MKLNNLKCSLEVCDISKKNQINYFVALSEVKRDIKEKSIDFFSCKLVNPVQILQTKLFRLDWLCQRTISIIQKMSEAEKSLSYVPNHGFF